MWHSGDQVRWGAKTWRFTTYTHDGLEQWVSSLSPDLWRVLPPVTTVQSDIDRARKAGPDRTHRDTMYRLLADMQLPLLVGNGRWSTDGNIWHSTAEDAIYAAWMASSSAVLQAG